MSAVPTVWLGVPLGLVLAAIGSVGTWESSELEVFGQSESTRESGIGEGGEFVLLFTIAAAVLLVLWRDGRQAWQAIAGAVGGLAAVIVCVLGVSNVNDSQATALGDVGVGWGLWLALVGSIVLTLSALVLALRNRGGTG